MLFTYYKTMLKTFKLAYYNKVILNMYCNKKKFNLKKEKRKTIAAFFTAKKKNFKINCVIH